MVKILLWFLFMGLAISCAKLPAGGTPKEFISNVVVSDSLYKKDSVSILSELYNLMRAHKESFNNPEYFDSTVLLVDSILYDSSLNKIAVFVVAKNPVYRNRYSDSKLPFYYNANCYLGRRKQYDSSIFELMCLCKFSEINFYDSLSVVEALKDDFFCAMSTVLDENEKPVFEYNINDKRFWISPTGWKRMFE